MLLWAGRFGKQEAFMSNLNKRHFEQGSSGESASERRTLLAAAADVGLDVSAAQAFLNTDELVSDVWRSYGETINKRGIHSIPLCAVQRSERAAAAIGTRSGSDRNARAHTRSSRVHAHMR
jgi:predicted DsbA family dithiol-disulfide isomerase